MTSLRDPSAIHSQLHRQRSLDFRAKRHSSSRLDKRASIADLSSLVRNTLAWAGETLNTYRDGLSKEQRERKLRETDREQLLYMKMRNVSNPRPVSLTFCVVKGNDA